MNILVHTHSGLRWVVLILMLAAIFVTFSGWRGKKEWSPKDIKISMFAMIAFHTQYTLGLIMYFISPKVQFVSGMMGVTVLRFFAIEHIFGMTLAMILITMGYSKSKRIEDSMKKHKTIFWYYVIALLLVIATIPWPFRTELGSQWF